MGIAERKEREKAELRTRIVEAARDILSERGLDALSMRAIAERIEYSPATIYLYFRDKDDLIREVVEQAFHTLSHYMRDGLAVLGKGGSIVEQQRALARAYVSFALENTAYFRVMFELPGVAQLDCPEACKDGVAMTGERAFDMVVATLQRAVDEGTFRIQDASRGAVIAWGMIHGLTSLFVGSHLAGVVGSREEFEELVEQAMEQLFLGWAPRETPPGGPA